MYKLAYVEDILDYADYLSKEAAQKDTRKHLSGWDVAGNIAETTAGGGLFGVGLAKSMARNAMLGSPGLTGPAMTLAGLGAMGHGVYRSARDIDVNGPNNMGTMVGAGIGGLSGIFGGPVAMGTNAVAGGLIGNYFDRKGLPEA